MPTVPPLAAHLVRLDADDLARLLSARPEVLAGKPPRDLADLAVRLDDPGAVALVLRRAPLPCLQLSQALVALGGSTRRTRLLRLLGVDEHDPGVAEQFTWLAERALVHSPVEAGGTADEADDVLVGSPGMAAVLVDPLGLGPSLELLVGDMTGDVAKKVLRQIGVPTPAKPWTRAGALAALTAALSDPDTVRAIAAEAPDDVSAWLLEQAWGTVDEGFSYDPAAYRRTQQAQRWAAARGLVATAVWGYAPQMPAEVALALRGPGYRVTFTPIAPPVATAPVATAAVEQESAATATTFAAQSVALLDLVRSRGVPTLKSGGVGLRELGKLAAATSTSTVDVRLVLELAASLGLVEDVDQRLVVTSSFAAWRAAAPGEQYASLVAQWWRTPVTATRERREDKPLPALKDEGCEGCAAARRALLVALADLPQGEATDAAAVGPLAQWLRPLVHAAPEQGDVPFADHWREAELLGLVARGALTALGRLVAAGEGSGLVAEAERVLPGAVDHALFGTDATAMVPGTPSARVTALLDLCADRESRGAGVVWRLTPGSVRRALDEGRTGEQLLEELTGLARGALPQALAYLVGDVARRHGSLRVRAATSVIRSDDTALLAQAAADRSLRRLGLALLAPTVLTSTSTDVETVEALRAAGYLPVREGSDGAVVRSAGGPGATGGSGATGTAGGSAQRASALSASVLPAPAVRLVQPLSEQVDVVALAARLHAAGRR